ncbi:Disease resistance protein RPM1 [Dichanthelium oligosanthes]|uniref:Disease resistance protein RPM1 n=1 Tax=Dichanthelium oligosanthes TaxID=888268 RepID=A0A1E5VY43_9POAL|nr:Disease resistance protein RPM1 [Dichanthelium oligosanthes]
MVGVTASALMGVMNPLLGKLSGLLEKEYNNLKGDSRKIAFLRDELSSMSAALDMVSEQDEANLQIRDWMSQLRELAYDVEDFIEIFMHHLGNDETCDGFINKIINKINTLKARRHISNQANELKERVLEVNDRRKRYKFDLSASCTKTEAIDPRLSALFEEGERLVGIDSQVEIISKWLIDDMDLHPHRTVVSIVGFGGLGKTTLANQVFQKIKRKFSCTGFVSVSRSPNVNKILNDAFLQVLKSSSNTSADQHVDIARIYEELGSGALEYPQLVNMIRDYLQSRRYFVVIDDIWSKQAWKDIQCAFSQDRNASRIITTTRIEDVAKACSFPYNDYVYHMKPLDSNDSKRLFLKRTFSHEDNCPSELKDITDDILRKCDGLPLAIVNIASLLATKETSKQEWERVKNSLCSALEQDGELEVVKKILFFSYYDLPHYLKICLLDLSIFPEDYAIDRLRLIRRWMAEGFIIEQRGQCLEDTGENYISELINRNMIQPVNTDYSGRPKACRVHDIMLDLIISLSTKENFVTIMDDQKLTPSAHKMRRISIQGNSEERKLWQGNSDLSHVRSLSVFGDAKKILPLRDFQVLRVLDLNDFSNLVDGDIGDIGSLIHLRYSSIKNVSKMPSQIGKLRLLQTLDLAWTNVKELPGTLVQLRQLVHLMLPRDVKLPDGISNLVCLEEISNFSVANNSAELLLEIGNLTKLKVLGVDWFSDGRFCDDEIFKTNLVSSLCKLGERALRSLGIWCWKPKCSLDFLVDLWSVPRQLQTFGAFPFGLDPCFSTLPKFTSPRSELRRLEFWVERLTAEDMQMIEGLPALLYLDLRTTRYMQETLTISGSGFQHLKEFECHVLMDWLGLKFEAGAVPRIEKLFFGFPVHDTISAHGVGFDFGISHLSSLKCLQVDIKCEGATAREVEAVEAAIKNAASLLPNLPIPEIKRLMEDQMVKKDEQSEDTSGDAEQDAEQPDSSCAR